MFLTKKLLFASSVLALGAAHCGGGSTPPSNTPEAPAEASEMSGDTSSSAGTTNNAADAADSAPENSGAHASMNLNDPQIVKVIDNVHVSEIEQARLAQQRASSEEVRQFAAMMIQQHTQAQQQGSALNLGKEESPLSQQLSTQSRATLQELSSKQGEEFDQAYIQAQIVGHQKVLEAIQNELRPNAQSPELQVYLQELQPKVQQHLEHAEHAQQALQSSTTRSRSSSTARSD